MFVIFVLVLAIIVVLLSYVVFPERKADDIDYRLPPSPPTPSSQAEESPASIWSVPSPYSDGYTAISGSLIEETPAKPSKPGREISKGDWYSHYRDYIGLSHAEIQSRFPQAPNLDAHKASYESKKK